MMRNRVSLIRKRTNWASRIHPLLLLALVSVANSKKLGSTQKPNDCEPEMYQCPARSLCLPRRRLDGNHCVCNRFLGFRGPECRKRSRASWLVLVTFIINTCMSFRALILNLVLALELKNAGRLKANSIGRTLFFNTVILLPAMAILLLTIILEVVEFGKDFKSDFLRKVLEVCLVCLFFFYLLSTLSVSMVWIVDVQRISSLGLGTENQLAKKQQERIWLLVTYGIALSSVILAIALFASTYAPLRNGAIVAVTYNFLIAGSYHYAGRRVVRDLSVLEVDPTARHVDIAQIADNIRITSQAMTRLTLGMSVSCIGATLTTPAPIAIYDAQNSLPRILQGQIFVFFIQQCGIGINNLIVEYMRYGISKRHLKPDSVWTFGSAFRWLFCRRHPHLSREAVVPVAESGRRQSDLTFYQLSL